jgi:hypothetical protein
MHFAYGSTQGKVSPYGYSIEQPAYPIWIKKEVTNRLYQSALGRCANPMVVVYADATKAVYNLGHGDINAVEAAYSVMQTYSEDTAVILPGRKGELYDIEVVKNDGNFEVYEKALIRQNADLEKLHLVPEGIFSTATTFAGATAQNSIFTKLMGGIAEEIVQHVLLGQFVKFLITENFGKHIIDLGNFESELQNIDDKLKYQKLYEGMTNDGYLDNTNPVDIQRVRKTLGEPTLDDESVNILAKKNKETALTSKNDNSKKTNTKEVGDHYTKRSVTDV